MITITARHLSSIGLEAGKRLSAVQVARQAVGDDEPQVTKAQTFIRKMVETSIDQEYFLTVDPINHHEFALCIAQHIAEQLVQSVGKEVDGDQLVRDGVLRVQRLMSKPGQQWLFTRKVVTIGSGAPAVVKQMIADIAVSVAVNDDGKIRKGGREKLVEGLYQKRVLHSGTPVTNQEFVAMIVSEVGMTLAGARTYAHNVDKKFGGKLVKRQRA